MNSSYPGSGSSAMVKGKKVVLVSPNGMGREQLFQLLKQREVPQDGPIRGAPNLARLKVKTAEKSYSIIDFWEAVPDGQGVTPGPGGYKSLTVDAKAVIHVVSNAQADSIDRLVQFLAPAPGIVGQRYLVVNQEVPDHMASLTSQQVGASRSYVHVRSKDILYVNAKTGQGLDEMILTITTNLKSKPKNIDSLAE